MLGVGEGDLGTVPLLLSQENRSGSGVREKQVHSLEKIDQKHRSKDRNKQSWGGNIDAAYGTTFINSDQTSW